MLGEVRDLDIDQTDVEITGGNISGVTFIENTTTAIDPALNVAVSTANVDAYNGVLITLTGAGNNQTIQDPTNVAQIKKYTVINNDTSTDSIDVISASGTHTLAVGQVETFIWDGSAWNQIDVGIDSIPVKVIQGGTGLATITDHGIMLGSGTGNVTPLAEASNGQIPIGSTGADPVLATLTAGNGIDVTEAAGAITIDTDLKANGGVVIESTELAVDLGASSITGTLAVGDGGTGATTASGARTNLEAIKDIVEDTTPQLGGDLDADGYYLNNSPTISNLASHGAGYWFDGVSDHISMGDDDTFTLPDNSFSLLANVNLSDATSGKIITKAGATSREEYKMETNIFTDNVFIYLFDSGTETNYSMFMSPNSSMSYNKNVSLCFTYSSGTGVVYIDGEATVTTKVDISLGFSVFSNTIQPLYIGRYLTSYIIGSIYKTQLYNKALTATEVKDLYSNANIAYKYEGANNTGLTSGTLVIGKEYIITTFVTGDDFTNVGAASNATGVVFTATDTAPTDWTNGSTLTRQGNVADYNSAGVSDATWYDQSGNGNDGTVSGALPVGVPEHRVLNNLELSTGAVLNEFSTDGTMGGNSDTAVPTEKAVKTYADTKINDTNDIIKDTHIDWGTGANQVSAVDVPIADAGSIITATEVEGALQENRTAIDLNTAKATNVPTELSAGTVTATTYGITSDGSADDIVLPEADTTNAGILGSDKWDEIVANTVHKSSNGTDHEYINQDVQSTASPSFAGLTNTGFTKRNTTVVNASTYTLLVSDDILLVTYPTTGTITITIPMAQIIDGRIIEIKDASNNASVNNITIETEGSEKIEFTTDDFIINGNGDCASFATDGTDLFII